MAEPFPEHMQQPVANGVTLTADQVHQPDPIPAGFRSERVRFPPMRPPEGVRLDHGTVIAQAAVASQYVIEEALLEVVLAVRLVDLGPQHRNVLGKGDDLERLGVQHQRGPEGDQEAPEPAGRRLHGRVVAVAQDELVGRQPAVPIDQDTLTDAVIFIGREIAALPSPLSGWGRR